MAYAEIGNATYGQAAAKSATVTSAIEEFDSALGRADNYAERLQKLSDRIIGTRPEPVSSGIKDVLPPASTISALQHRRARLANILDGMERSIEALERSI